MTTTKEKASPKIQSLDFEKPLIQLKKQIADLEKDSTVDVSENCQALRQQLEEMETQLYEQLTPAQKLQIARHPQRPNTLEVIQGLSPETWFELHGDRMGKDDRAIVGGVIELGGKPAMILGTQKGRSMKENLVHNFGMANPEGYRKALRLFQHAEKFKMPVITLIDTPGAYPGIEGEQHAVGHAIALNIREMSRLNVPIISIVMGEASSGGALGIGISNHIYMLEHAQYTVISPEGCASILWRDASFATTAAEALKITAQDLYRFGICDAVIEEPRGGAHYNPEATISAIAQQIHLGLDELNALDIETLKEQRFQKYRQIGAVGNG
ncbi:MAG: acetyl-CoA carboxylase carboxyltransferase subunit alpha [Vampirovibrionales bacterium]